MNKHLPFPILLVLIIFSHYAWSDTTSARATMEDESNPLMLLSTSLGDIYIELFTNEAPKNVENFIALAQGRIEFNDPNSRNTFTPRYFDGMQFHKVVPGMFIQAGSPQYHPLGLPKTLLNDEINANSLALNNQQVMDDFGRFNPLLNIINKSSFHKELLDPIVNYLNISSESELLERQYEIYDLIVNLTLKRAYEIRGYRYNTDVASRAISRSIVALANSGPNTNGPEFFIATSDLPMLNGRHTVIGRVVEGMETVDSIGKTEIDPLKPSRFATLIYSLRNVD